MQRTSVAGLVAIALAVGAPDAGAAAPYDFNNDGYQELVAGLPDLREGRHPQAGAVLVIPGSRRGLVPARRRTLTQSSTGIPDASERWDRFGREVESEDFDGDGYADLAIASEERVGTSHGAVTVLYGSARGLTGNRATQLAGGLSPVPEEGDAIEWPLVAGDLDRDGYADLVLGATRGWAGITPTTSGTVRIFFGGSSGITRSRERELARPDPDDMFFGFALALGDVDGDGHLDLVEGAPGNGYFREWGHLSYCAGAPEGPTTCRSLTGRSGTEVDTFEHPREGPASLAVGDVTGDGYPDVVEGVPDDRWTPVDQDFFDSRGLRGVVLIRHGTPDGPSQRRLIISEDSRGVPGKADAFGAFGSAVAVARLGRDRYADIVVGASGDRRVTVLRGSPGGIRPRGAVSFGPATRRPEAGFGATVTLLDYNGDGRLDLTIGSGWADKFTGAWHRGVVTTVMGRRAGFAVRSARRFDGGLLKRPPATWIGLGSVLGA